MPCAWPGGVSADRGAAATVIGPCRVQVGTATLEVTVLEDQLGPRPETGMTIASTDHCIIRFGTTDEHGRALFTDLPDETYFIVHSAKRDEWQTVTVKPGSNAATVTWPAGTTRKKEALQRRKTACKCGRGDYLRFWPSDYYDDWPEQKRNRQKKW